MINFSLFMILFKQEINTINFLGENLIIHAKINQLISTKQITQSDQADLTVINQESPQFIEYFWRNHLSENIKWLVILPRNKTEAIIIYKEMRSFAETILIQSENPIIIFKEFKKEFEQFYRQEILLPIEEKNLNEFLKIEAPKNNLELVFVAQGNEEEQIAQCLMSSSMFVYFGKEIDEKCLQLCQLLANMKFNIIEIVSKEYKNVGYFVHRDFLEKTLIYSLTHYKILESILKFDENKISIPSNN